MSDVGRYRKLYARLWRHPGFTGLNDSEKVLAVYLLTGPQTNRVGLYVLSIAQTAEDLRSVEQTISKRLVKVCQTFGWQFDRRSRVFFCPSWFKWNRPENENVLKGSLKDLNEIPPSGLIDAFARNLETLPATLHETFIEGLRQRLPDGVRTQDQYQEPYQNPNQKPKPSARRAGSERQEIRATDGGRVDLPEYLLTAAREAIRLNSPKRPIDELTDGLKELLRVQGKGDCSTRDALVAVNIALAELRTIQ